MSDALVIYPRSIVVIKAILSTGEEIDTPLAPSKLSVSLRPHHQASECDVTVNQSALPFDVRAINGIWISCYMGAMRTVTQDGPNDPYVQRQENLVFCGYADSVDIKRSNDGTSVSIKARDLSSFLRDEKNMVIRKIHDQRIDPVPAYSDSVVGALKNLMAWAGISSDQIAIVDKSKDGRASQPMTAYTNKKGAHSKIPMRAQSAWQVVEHLAGMASLLIHIDRGDLIIREPVDAFVPSGDKSSPVAYSFVFGDRAEGQEAELIDLQIKKSFLRNRKGVRLVAFDPTQKGAARKIEAIYPPDDQLPPKKRVSLGPRKQRKHTKATTTQPLDPDRETIPVGHLGIQSKDKLEEAAKRYYLERSRQEIQGELTTAIWTDELFALRNADRIQIRVKPSLESELRNIKDRSKQVQFLKEKMAIEGVAAAALLDATLSRDSDVMYLRTITHEWSTEGARTKVDFIGIITIDFSKGS